MPKQITLENPKINNLVTRIAAGEVKIPPLQRPFVWKVSQIIELLESIYNDYPIGSILWWETNEKLPSERNIAGFKLPEKPESHPFYYVLDGQQRLSSLYGVFCDERTLGDCGDEYKVDPSIFEIFFDCGEKRFVHLADKIDGTIYFEMKALFDPSKYADALVKASDPNKRIITDLYNKFTNYEIPIVVTKKRELEEVGIIFERVNNTGTKLDLFDLMVALTWTTDFHLQNEFKDIQSFLKKKNFDGIKNKVLLQCISVMLRESCKTKVITSLKGAEIRDNIAALKESLKKTIDFLSTELKIGSREVLPHAHQVVPLCYLYSKVTTPSADQINAMKKWFWKTSFSTRYSAGTDKNVDEDVILFKKLVEDNELACFDDLKHAVTMEVLKTTKFLRSNPFSRAFVVLLANKAPLNLTNGSSVDVGIALSSFNQKEYHHVFPDAHLERTGVSRDKINSLCNFCLLPADANKIISDIAPSEYFTKIIPKAKYKDILQSNLLPLTQEIYSKNEYDKFLDERSQKILESIEEQLL
jgi:hypothetical protein